MYLIDAMKPKVEKKSTLVLFFHAEKEVLKEVNREGKE